MKPLTLLGMAVSLVVASGAAAQTTPQPIFSPLDAAVASEARSSMTALPKGVSDRQLVGMRLDRLFDPATTQVVLNVDGQEWVAAFERLDADILGHRAWVGSIEGIQYSHVSFAERNGVVSGVINAGAQTYAVRTIAPGVYTIDRVVEHGQELEPLVPAVPDLADAPAAVIAGDDGSLIDVLLLYTPGARDRVGGTTQINAMLAQIISDTNTAYSRSGIATRVRLVGSSEAPLPETASMSADLTTFRNNAAVAGLRDSTRADLVQLIMNSPDTNSCGIGYIFTSAFLSNPAVFPAYSISDYSCVSQYTPSHEMGHNMGSHHAPEDNASGALFSYSYGYKNPAAGFRTIMAYACSGANCPRIPNFSNPGVSHVGAATGTATQNNALSINNAASAVSNMRQAGAVVTPPSAPTGLTSQVTGLSARLSWNAVTGDLQVGASAATGYVLQVGTQPGNYNLLTLPVGNTTSVSGSASAGTYYWRVFGTNIAGNGTPSAEAQFTLACAPPGAPQNFSHSIGANRIVTLSWSAPASGGGPFSYTIDVGSSTGQDNLLRAPVGAATSISVSAPPGTYYVRIRAANACAPTSPPSNERTIVVP